MEDVGNLVISRLAGEGIRIDGPCDLVITEIDKGRSIVKVAIRAPQRTTIQRWELITGDSKREPAEILPRR